MSREEKINKMIEEIKIRRNDEQYKGGPFPIYHIEFDILNEEIERLKRRLEEYQEYVEINHKEIERLNNIINKIEEHFVFLKMNSTGGNKEFFEDILDFIKALQELKGSDKK